MELSGRQWPQIMSLSFLFYVLPAVLNVLIQAVGRLTIGDSLSYNHFQLLSPIGKRGMKYLIGLLVLFEISDGLLTHYLVRDGLARESNPFLQPLVGDAGFMILKIVGVLICAIILWDIYKRYPRVALISTSCFVVFYGVIVLWNLSLFAVA